jgi:flagellar assembly factor FliW
MEGKVIDMLIMTKHFGEIDLDEDKIIHFDGGILGFENFKDYTLLFDNEEGDRSDISWLQSLDEPALSIPVISPFILKPDYNPEVEDELLKPLGEFREDNIIVLVSMTIPSDVQKMSINLKAPFVIHSETRKGAQIIVENADYEVKCLIYEKLTALKAAKEGR